MVSFYYVVCLVQVGWLVYDVYCIECVYVVQQFVVGGVLVQVDYYDWQVVGDLVLVCGWIEE